MYASWQSSLKHRIWVCLSRVNTVIALECNKERRISYICFEPFVLMYNLYNIWKNFLCSAIYHVIFGRERLFWNVREWSVIRMFYLMISVKSSECGKSSMMFSFLVFEIERFAFWFLYLFTSNSVMKNQKKKLFSVTNIQVKTRSAFSSFFLQ